MSPPLVTLFGATGFIGRHVVRRLAAKGARIKVACREPSDGLHLQPLGNVGQIALVRADLKSEASVAKMLEGARAAINLVGILYESGRSTFAEVHGELPARIGHAARAADVESVVHISAIGADPGSASAYARSKAKGETNLRGAFEEAVILRPSIVVGPEDGFFNRFAQMAMISPALPLIGGGRTRFQPVYVGDVADAVMAGLERREARGEVFELGGPRVYNFAELLRYMLEVTGRKRALVDLPYGIAAMQARVLEYLPAPPLTRDQIELLKKDNVVAAEAKTLGDLGLTPTPIETVVPHYMEQYRRFPRPRRRLT